MKKMVTFVLLTLSIQAFAFTEVECEGILADKTIQFEVERPFPQGSYFKDARLEITQEGRTNWYSYQMTTYVSPGFNRVRYQAPGAELEVDFWPDQRPQWGRIYRGELRTRELNHQMARLNCRFM